MGDGLDNETLAVKIRCGDGDRKELLEELWRNNERLVHKIVHGLTGLDSWKAEDRQDFEDMEQQAFIGITEAAGSFDEGQGVKFFTWAAPYIKKSIYQYHDSGGYRVRIPAYLRRRMKLYAKEKALMEGAGQRNISPDEIMDRMGLVPAARKSLMDAMQAAFVSSLDETIENRDGDRQSLLDTLAGDGDMAGEVYYRELHDTMRSALSRLPEREREIVTAVYYQGHSPNYVARVMGCSRQNIDQRLKNAYVHLRHGKYGRKLASFL